MADAKKCDRCGAFYEKYSPGTHGAPFNGLDEMLFHPSREDMKLVKRLELCPSCANYLDAMIHIKPVRGIGGDADGAD